MLLPKEQGWIPDACTHLVSTAHPYYCETSQDCRAQVAGFLFCMLFPHIAQPIELSPSFTITVILHQLRYEKRSEQVIAQLDFSLSCFSVQGSLGIPLLRRNPQ